VPVGPPARDATRVSSVQSVLLPLTGSSPATQVGGLNSLTPNRNRALDRMGSAQAYTVGGVPWFSTEGRQGKGSIDPVPRLGRNLAASSGRLTFLYPDERTIKRLGISTGYVDDGRRQKSVIMAESGRGILEAAPAALPASPKFGRLWNYYGGSNNTGTAGGASANPNAPHGSANRAQRLARRRRIAGGQR